MITNYLFDVDGTLTPPRESINPEFKKLFAHWVGVQRSNGHKVFFVTGSDRDKTVEQVGLPLWRFVDGSYQCSGNQLYSRGKLIKQSNWMMSAELHYDIIELLEKSRWYGKADKNIEERVGMVNISTVGRSATNLLRKEYFDWDNRNHERVKIKDELSAKYEDLEFSIGGEISIDIYPKGRDKSQVLSDMQGDCMFFGDRCDIGGNDYKIAVMCKHYFNVSGWEETHEILAKML
jgi:phosphomannomutase